MLFITRRSGQRDRTGELRYKDPFFGEGLEGGVQCLNTSRNEKTNHPLLIFLRGGIEYGGSMKVIIETKIRVVQEETGEEFISKGLKHEVLYNDKWTIRKLTQDVCDATWRAFKSLLKVI